MKGLVIVLVILSVMGVLLGREFVAVRNDLTTQKEGIRRSWSDLDDVLRRRTDLIPGFIDLVKGYGKGETAAIETLGNSRTAMLDAQTPRQKIDAYYQMNSALTRLLEAIENYPRLKDTERYKSLGYRFKETENAVLEARQRYNEAIKKYNTTLSLFPNNVVARLSGFTRDDAYFKTDVNARTAPKVTF